MEKKEEGTTPDPEDLEKGLPPRSPKQTPSQPESSRERRRAQRQNDEKRVPSASTDEETVVDDAPKSIAVNVMEGIMQQSASTQRVNQILSQRLEQLEKQLRSERSAIQITNPSFELGRPRLQPTSDMRGDTTNPYNKISIDQLLKIRPKAISNNMATTEEIAKLTVEIEGLGVPKPYITTVILQAVFYCKDASSSIYLDPQGSFEFPGGMIGADAVIALMRKDATSLRRICRLYAPVTWNYMLSHNSPPSDWAAMGFHKDDRFAAFDCFDYVENEAAVQPLEGLIRAPTPREKIAHETYKRLALDRANRNEIYSNYATEITGGVQAKSIERDFTKAPVAK